MLILKFRVSIQQGFKKIDLESLVALQGRQWMWREPRYERVRERKYGDEGMEERAQLLYPLEERVLNESRSVKP